MSAFPLPPPATSIASRVAAFLPVIEKANKDLEEKIARDGAESVRIDTNLASGAAEGGEGEAEDAASKEQTSKAKGMKPKKNAPLIVEVGTEKDRKHGEEEEEKGEEEDVEEDGGEGDGAQERQVQLEFALGDFDETPIAQAEDAVALAAENDTGEKEDGEREIVFKEAEEGDD